MKRTLTLVRHAKSSWKDARLADYERPLKRRGERDAPRMGRRLREAGIRPSLILSSPARRAWTTAQLIAEAIGCPGERLQREPELYLASLETILAVLAAQSADVSSLMLVGHNPGLASFGNYLVPGSIDKLPSGGVIAVEFEQAHWSFYALPRRRLALYDYPGRLRSRQRQQRGVAADG